MHCDAPADAWESCGGGGVDYGASPYTPCIKSDAPLDARCVHTLRQVKINNVTVNIVTIGTLHRETSM